MRLKVHSSQTLRQASQAPGWPMVWALESQPPWEDLEVCIFGRDLWDMLVASWQVTAWEPLDGLCCLPQTQFPHQNMQGRRLGQGCRGKGEGTEWRGGCERR